jgi:hypothetical protein
MQLIQSRLYDIQVYWSSFFVLLKKIIKQLERKFSNYSGLVQMRRQVMEELARLQVVSQRMKGFLVLEGTFGPCLLRKDLFREKIIYFINKPSECF